MGRMKRGWESFLTLPLEKTRHAVSQGGRRGFPFMGRWRREAILEKPSDMIKKRLPTLYVPSEVLKRLHSFVIAMQLALQLGPSGVEPFHLLFGHFECVIGLLDLQVVCGNGRIFNLGTAGVKGCLCFYHPLL